MIYFGHQRCWDNSFHNCNSSTGKVICPRCPDCSFFMILSSLFVLKNNIFLKKNRPFDVELKRWKSTRNILTLKIISGSNLWRLQMYEEKTILRHVQIKSGKYHRTLTSFLSKLRRMEWIEYALSLFKNFSEIYWKWHNY